MAGRYESADWRALLGPVAMVVLGEPAERRGGEWRYGRRGSMVVNVVGNRAGHWHDFESGKGGGVLDLLAHAEGLDKTAAVEWLRARGLLDAGQRSPATAATESRGSAAPNPLGNTNLDKRLPESRTAYARRLWNSARPIPATGEHPARRWLAARRLWRPGFPLPAGLRWLPATGQHLGAGSIIAAVATPVDWQETWPNLPAPVAVQLVHVDGDGEPALDRPANALDRNEQPSPGLSKRSYGPTTGGVTVLGNPRLPDSAYPVRVAEGLADALGLAARLEGPAIATLGSSGLGADPLAAWLAGCGAGVAIHADADTGGITAARKLLTLCQRYGATARAVLPPEGKDAAANLAPFAPLADGWIDYARTLRETTDWPRWECARLAAIVFSEMEGERD